MGARVIVGVTVRAIVVTSRIGCIALCTGPSPAYSTQTAHKFANILLLSRGWRIYRADNLDRLAVCVSWI